LLPPSLSLRRLGDLVDQPHDADVLGLVHAGPVGLGGQFGVAGTTIARVLSVAKDHGKISVNVCERGGRLYDADRSDIIWHADDIRAFCEVASVELQAAML
jgi:hypothetical protein